MRLSNASTFRRYACVEESMIRAAMPRTSALDTETRAVNGRLVVSVANRGTSRLVKVAPVLTVSIAERMVCHA